MSYSFAIITRNFDDLKQEIGDSLSYTTTLFIPTGLFFETTDYELIIDSIKQNGADDDFEVKIQVVYADSQDFRVDSLGRIRPDSNLAVLSELITFKNDTLVFPTAQGDTVKLFMQRDSAGIILSYDTTAIFTGDRKGGGGAVSPGDTVTIGELIQGIVPRRIDGKAVRRRN